MMPSIWRSSSVGLAAQEDAERPSGMRPSASANSLSRQDAAQPTSPNEASNSSWSTNMRRALNKRPALANIFGRPSSPEARQAEPDSSPHERASNPVSPSEGRMSSRSIPCCIMPNKDLGVSQIIQASQGNSSAAGVRPLGKFGPYLRFPF